MTHGKHLLADLYEVGYPFLSDLSQLEGVVVRMAELAGATVRSVHSHVFLCKETGEMAPSVTAILEESGASLHVWPTERFVALDLYVCGENADPMKAYDYILDVFQPADHSLKFIHRGTKKTQPRYVTTLEVKKSE